MSDNAVRLFSFLPLHRLHVTLTDLHEIHINSPEFVNVLPHGRSGPLHVTISGTNII